MTPNPDVHRSAETARPAHWITFVVKAAAFLAVALVFSETLWHSLGYLPAKSDLRHFAKLRKAADQDPTAVALVGSSRVQQGLNPQSLQRAVPGRRFLQLGNMGYSGVPVLEDLARDPNFKGLVICELNPAHWGGPYPFPKLPETLTYTHPEVSGAYLEMLLGEQFRDHFSFFSYNLFAEVPNMLQHRAIPEPNRPDRFLPNIDLGQAINKVLIRNWERVSLEVAERFQRAGSSRIPQEVHGWVARIRRRGGDVGFVRMPIDGHLRIYEESVFLHTQSVIRDLRAQGIVAIDFAEMPEHFRCPDGSHLEVSEADRFSRRLGEDLAARGFFR